LAENYNKTTGTSLVQYEHVEEYDGRLLAVQGNDDGEREVDVFIVFFLRRLLPRLTHLRPGHGRSGDVFQGPRRRSSGSYVNRRRNKSTLRPPSPPFFTTSLSIYITRCPSRRHHAFSCSVHVGRESGAAATRIWRFDVDGSENEGRKAWVKTAAASARRKPLDSMLFLQCVAMIR
jgi:hypothetical protein